MSTKTQAPQIFCEHRVIHDQIHHFVFRRATHKSIDEFLQMLGDTLDATAPDAPLLLLLDLRPEGLPPIGYTFPALKKFFARYAYVEREMRVAYLYKSGSIISVLRTLLDVLRLRVTPRFFMDGQEDEALAWLRGG